MRRGAILYHPRFQFHDGEVADKFLVVLNNADKGDVLLLAKTTSQPKGRRTIPECDPIRNTFFIPAAKTFFSKDTWVILNKPYPVSFAEMAKRVMQRECEHRGNLPEQKMNAIRNCALKSDDIEVKWINLLKK